MIMKELNANISSLSVVLINIQLQDTIVVLILYTTLKLNCSRSEINK